MNQTAEYALLNVEDDTMRLWNTANEDTNDVNTDEMIDFLERKGKNPPLPLKKSGFRNFYAPTRYDPDQKYNMEQYNPFYVQRAKLAWKLYKTHQDQIQGHKSEEDRASRAEIDKDRYNKIKNGILNKIRSNFHLEDVKDIRRSIAGLNKRDIPDMQTQLGNALWRKKTLKEQAAEASGISKMFVKPFLTQLLRFKKSQQSGQYGGKSKRVTRVKRSRRVKRSTKRRKH